jgi:hypothetical protein
MWTTRRYPLAGCLLYTGYLSLLVAGFAVIAFILDPLAWQRTLDENDFAIDVCNTTAVLVKRFDFRFWHRQLPAMRARL